MATPQPGPPDGTARAKLDEDDHDLLTFSEAGERLRIEIAALAASIAEHEKSGTSDQLETAHARLAALRAAARRNATPPINDANFESFFGYPRTQRSTNQ